MLTLIAAVAVARIRTEPVDEKPLTRAESGTVIVISEPVGDGSTGHNVKV